MAARRLTAVDAQTYWMSQSLPDDQFMPYVFGDATDLDHALESIRGRARACTDLGLCISETGFWTYPEWVRRDVGPEQIVVHDLADATWTGCHEAVTALFEDQLDARELTWRLHVFPSVTGVPGADTATVAVLQICHSLADGTRASELAAHLFGRGAGVPPVATSRAPAAALPARAFRAAWTSRQMSRAVDAGLVPPQADSRPALRSNTRPSGTRHMRTVVFERSRFRDATVTVGVLAAISGALAGHLRALGDDPSQLGAEIPMVRRTVRQANNHFGNVGVGLYPDKEFGARVEAIAADLVQRRRRAAHPAMRAEMLASAAVPAPILRWGVAQFDPTVRSDTVIGNTVVSSVSRGAKDLRFGDAPVILATGMPALSPMMGVTHGVHGIGDTVSVSVHAAESSIGGAAGMEAYVARLAHELR